MGNGADSLVGHDTQQLIDSDVFRWVGWRAAENGASVLHTV